ncbi:hypothetical protein ES703_125855 [subsurface metagenome]
MKKSIIIALVLVLLLLSSCTAPTGVSLEEYARVEAEFEAAQAQIRTLENELEVAREELELTDNPGVVTEQAAINAVKQRLASFAMNEQAKQYLDEYLEWISWEAEWDEKVGAWGVFNGHWRRLSEMTEEEKRIYEEWAKTLEMGIGFDDWVRFGTLEYPYWNHAAWYITRDGFVIYDSSGGHNDIVYVNSFQVEWDILYLSVEGLRAPRITIQFE